MLNSLALGLIALVMGYVILLYVLSRLSSNDEWRNNYNIEMKQLLLSVLLYISIFSIANVVNLIYSIYFAGFDMFDYISIQLINILKNLHTFASHLTITGSIMKLTGEFTNIGYPHGAYGSARVVAYLGIDIISGAIFQIRDIMFIATGGLVVQSILMDLIKNLALTVILPIGIVLRILPIFRQFGNEIIGLSIASYLILPLIYSVFFQTLIDISSQRGGFIDRFANLYLDLSSNNPDMLAPDKLFQEMRNRAEVNSTILSVNNELNTMYFKEINSELGGTTSKPYEFYDRFEKYLTITLAKFGFAAGLPITLLFIFGLFIYASGFLVIAFGLPGFAVAITLTAAKSIRDSLERLI